MRPPPARLQSAEVPQATGNVSLIAPNSYAMLNPALAHRLFIATRFAPFSMASLVRARAQFWMVATLAEWIPSGILAGILYTSALLANAMCWAWRALGIPHRASVSATGNAANAFARIYSGALRIRASFWLWPALAEIAVSLRYNRLFSYGRLAR